MPALTESEASARAALITVDSYDVSLDLTTAPARSRTVVRFRCGSPGAGSFANLTALAGERGAVLNGMPLPAAAGGRLALSGLAAVNVLTVDAEIADRVLIRFAEPSGGGEYLAAFAYPTNAPGLFCCFDQLDMPAPLSLSLRAPAGWTCVANGSVAERPAPGAAGTWRFAPLLMKPLEFTFAAGPLRAAAVPAPATMPSAVPGAIRGPAPAAGVTLTSYSRSALADVTRGYLARYCAIAAGALRHHERKLGVPCPYPKYDIVALPDVPFRAACVPGLMLVSEDLLARLADPADDFAAMVAAHEVAHLWFGCLVGMRWWDDLWLEESLASYLSYLTDAGWASFSHGEKPRALRADELPSTRPVSSPVETMAQAVDRPNAITYVKGTAVIRQLTALIGTDAVTRGLAGYLSAFADRGTACLDDLVACWSRASGRDLKDWAQAWLRTPGTPRLAVRLTESPAAAIASLTVTQDLPRPHRVGVALYDAVTEPRSQVVEPRSGAAELGAAGLGAGEPRRGESRASAGESRSGAGEPRRGAAESPSGVGGRRRTVLRHRRTDLVELTGTATELSWLVGEPLPAAVFVNAGDWALAQVTLGGGGLTGRLRAVVRDQEAELRTAATVRAAGTGRRIAPDRAGLGLSHEQNRRVQARHHLPGRADHEGRQ